MKRKIITLMIVSLFLMLAITNVNASNLSSSTNLKQENEDSIDTPLKIQGYDNSKTFNNAKLTIFLDGADPLSLINIKGGGSGNLKIKNKLSKVPILTPIVVNLMKFFDKIGVPSGDFPSIPSVLRNKFDMNIEFVKEGNIEELSCYGTSINEYNTSSNRWEEKFDLKNKKHKIELTHKKVTGESLESVLDNCVVTCWWYDWLIDYEVPRSLICMECKDITVYYD